MFSGLDGRQSECRVQVGGQANVHDMAGDASQGGVEIGEERGFDPELGHGAGCGGFVLVHDRGQTSRGELAVDLGVHAAHESESSDDDFLHGVVLLK